MSLPERLAILATLVSVATLVGAELATAALERRARRRYRQDIARFWGSIFGIRRAPPTKQSPVRRCERSDGAALPPGKGESNPR